MQNNCNKSEMVYAGFWIRLAAYVIDAIIVFAGLLIVRLVLSGVMSVLEDTPLGGNILFHLTLKDIILYIVGALYFVLMTYYTGSTLGKRAMNLKVVSEEGNRPEFVDILYRETVGRFLCKVSMGIGYIMAGFDPKKRGLHDMLCDTRVIFAKKILVVHDERRISGYGHAPKIDFMPTSDVIPEAEIQLPTEHDVMEEKNEIIEEKNEILEEKKSEGVHD